MLRALLFAALFAAVLAVVYTKSTSAEDVIKKLDANQEKLDQLNARIQNLKNKLKARVAAREEADRKSKNMLLRLDRMDIKDGSYHCHKSTDGRQTNFKCRTGQQCVPNILVCDNKVDCEDGSDEDEDFCILPFKVGQLQSGKTVYYACTSGESTASNIKSEYFYTSAERSEVFPSMVQVTTLSKWTNKNESIRSANARARYTYADRTLYFPWFAYNGVVTAGRGVFPIGSNVVYFNTILANTGDECARAIGYPAESSVLDGFLD